MSPLRRLRAPRALVIVTVVGAGLALALLVLRSDSSDRGHTSAGRLRILPAPAAGEPTPPLECEAEGYPCSWGAAADAVWARSMELGMLAAERFAAGGPVATGEWLRSQAEVVSVRLGPEVAGFRLDGGRYTWVGPEPAAAPRVKRTAGLPGRSLWSRLLDLAWPAVHAQVVGQDQNNDGKLNQRDFRRALLVDKTTGDLSDIQGVLEGSPFYAGHVTVRKTLKVFPDDDYAPPYGWQDFLGWQNFDLIHVATSATTTCDDTEPPASSPGLFGWIAGILGSADQEGDDQDEPPATGPRCQLRGLWTGDRFARARTDSEMPEAYRRLLQAENRALDMQIFRIPDEDPASFDVVVLATPDFFGQVYRTLSMDRRLVFLDGRFTFDDSRPLYQRIFGSGRRSMLIGRIDDDDPDEDLTLELYQDLVKGLTVLDSAILQPNTGYKGEGSSVRIREIVTLHDQDGELLRDKMELPIRGTAGDGQNDFITLLKAKVVGLVPDYFDDPDYLDKAVAWLEVDGNAVGSEMSLMEQPADGNTITVPFENVPLEFDIDADELYDVDVVVKLEGRFENSESRYSVRLAPPLVGYRVMVTGGSVTLPVLSGRRVAGQLNVVLGMADDRVGPEPDLSPFQALTIVLPAARAFVEGANTGLVTIHFRDLGYTCSGFSGNGFELTLARIKPLDGAFEGRVVCTPGKLDDPTRFRDNLRQRFEAQASGRFRGR